MKKIIFKMTTLLLCLVLMLSAAVIPVCCVSNNGTGDFFVPVPDETDFKSNITEVTFPEPKKAEISLSPQKSESEDKSFETVAKESFSPFVSQEVNNNVAVSCEAAESSAFSCRSRLNPVSTTIYDNVLGLCDKLFSFDEDYPATSPYDFPMTEKFHIYSSLTDEQKNYLVIDVSDLDVTKNDCRLIVNQDGTASYSANLYNKASNEMSKRINSFVDYNSILFSLLADNPFEMFWFDKKTGGMRTYSNYNITCNDDDYEYNSSDGNFYVTRIRLLISEAKNLDITLQVLMSISDDYRSGYYNYSPSDDGVSMQVNAFSKTIYKNIVIPAKAKADGIVEKYKSYSDYNKLKAYHDEICSLAKYDNTAAGNPDTPYGAPWQMISIFDDDDSTKVVCEGYAKAFKYLCDNSSFTDKTVSCITVIGKLYQNNTSLGDHMWNIVKYSGKNYLVDVTNDDSNSCETLFLKDPKAGSAERQYIFYYTPNIFLSYEYNESPEIDYKVLQETIFGSEMIILSPEFAYGDVNRDGKINVSDCVKTTLIANKKVTASVLDKFLADVDYSGIVTADDASKIADLVCGNIKDF